MIRHHALACENDAAGAQLAGRECPTQNPESQTFHHGSEQGGRVVYEGARTVCHGGPASREPARPIDFRPVQQRVFRGVAVGGQGTVFGECCRCGDGHEPFVQELLAVQTFVASGAEPQGDVEIRSGKINQLRG